MIYFDNAATTFPKPEKIYKEMDYCARNYAVNVGRGQYSLSDDATIIVEDTRKKLLDFFNAKNAQVVFSSSATIALNQVIRGIDFSNIKNVYISYFEHNAVLRTLNYLKEQYKFNIHYLNIKRNPFGYEIDEIRKQFNEYCPDLLIISHASNVCGAVAPIYQILNLSKNFGAINIVDVAQSAGIIDINYSLWEIDFLVFAGHKGLLGPFGIAGFILKNSNNSIIPYITGGTGFDSINPFMPNVVPSKYEAGSLNINAVVGLNASLKFMQTDEYLSLKNNDYEMLNEFEKIISCFDEIKIIGANYNGERVPVISIIHEDYSPDELGLILNKNNIAVRTGLHCSPLAHQFFSTIPAGTIRFSFGIFNKIDELNKLKQILEEL